MPVLMLAVTVDWTQVLVVGVPAYIAAVFAGVAMLLGAHNRRALKIPSGGTIGEKVEKAHDLAAVNAADVAARSIVTEGKLDTVGELVNGRLEEALKKVDCLSKQLADVRARLAAVAPEASPPPLASAEGQA